jgi:tRNA A-37 threonylcarbamoyl transferase component Bud32
MMDELRVRVKYSSLPARVMLYLVLGSIPIWGVFFPIIILLMLGGIVLQPEILLQQPILFLGFNGGLLVTTCIFALASIALADDRLMASKEGLRIPFHLSLLTKMRRDFSWQEIESIVFAGDVQSNLFSILFKTRAGLSFAIRSERIKESELEQFLLALELWVDSDKVDQRLLQIKESLQRRLCLNDSQKQSYTAMWEDELERRFASTAFVVLEPEAFLQSGRLKVVRQLSFGGLSAVYLCQMDKRELVVLKESVVPADSSEELRLKAEEMFAREARLLMRLKHPNIVGVLDYFVEKGRNYLLLEHVNGQDLNQFVRQHGPQPEYRVIEWAKKLADVLSYLHSQEPPIMHRDLSPDNMVLDENHTLKIIDFGAANEFIGTATGTLVGKQAYLPMEQLRGKTVPQSDIYAFGGTLFYLLTGEDPEPLSVSCPRQRRPEVSEFMDDLVSRCTSSDFKKRPAGAAEIKEALTAAFSESQN